MQEEENNDLNFNIQLDRTSVSSKEASNNINIQNKIKSADNVVDHNIQVAHDNNQEELSEAKDNEAIPSNKQFIHSAILTKYLNDANIDRIIKCQSSFLNQVIPVFVQLISYLKSEHQ